VDQQYDGDAVKDRLNIFSNVEQSYFIKEAVSSLQGGAYSFQLLCFGPFW
jgi:hypothetical protein